MLLCKRRTTWTWLHPQLTAGWPRHFPSPKTSPLIPIRETKLFQINSVPTTPFPRTALEIYWHQHFQKFSTIYSAFVSKMTFCMKSNTQLVRELLTVTPRNPTPMLPTPSMDERGFLKTLLLVWRDVKQNKPHANPIFRRSENNCGQLHIWRLIGALFFLYLLYPLL